MKFWLLTRPWNQVQKPVMLEDCFEEEEEEEEEGEEEEEEVEHQQQPASAEVAITNNGQRNQPNCSAICVLAAKESAHCTRCDVGLCVVPCFTEYHTKVNL